MSRRLAAYAVLVAAVIAAVPRIAFRDLSRRFGGDTLAIHVARVMEGDNPQWAQPSFDDGARPETLLYGRNPDTDAFWIRRTIRFDDSDAQRELAVYVSMLAAHETYWDGVRIGASGTIDALGRAASAGPIDNFYTLDRAQCAPGPHLLAIRVAPGPGPYGFQGIAVGDTVTMIRNRTAAQMIPIAGLGVFVVIGAYFLSIFGAARKSRDLVFALLCFAAASLVLVETWRWIFGMPYTWQPARLLATEVLTFAVAWLLPAFLTIDLFGTRRRPARFGALAGVLVIATFVARGGGSDMRCLAMFAASIAMSASILIEAAIQRRRRIIPGAVGVAALVLSLVMGGYGFSDSSFFIAFAILILVLLVSMAREAESAKLRAARLEIELLQKTIQPHFLMNTLTAVMEWIEEDPPAGLRFLEALADELRIFSEVSTEPLIPLARELELCRTHLAIMSYRQGTRFELEADGIDTTTALLPPATLHTLIENALTHNRYDGEPVVFRLTQSAADGAQRYVFDAPLAKRPPRKTAKGIGLRYVRARLEESFPGRWTMSAGAHHDVWRTTIEVRA